MAFRRLRLGFDAAEAGVADVAVGASDAVAHTAAVSLRNDRRFMGRLHLYTKEQENEGKTRKLNVLLANLTCMAGHYFANMAAERVVCLVL
jgi:hypothetical protein